MPERADRAKTIARRLGWLAVLLLSGSLAVLAQTAGEAIEIRQPVDNDFYGAAREVEISAAVAGDAVVAGQRIRISGRIGGDVIAAGELVTLEGIVADDVRAAGRWVRVSGPVHGHLVAAGEDVEIDSGVSIGDWAWLAGRRLRVSGSIGQELKAAGQTIAIDGQIGGNVDLTAANIRIEPGAVIAGNLIWRAEDPPQISDEARIDGQIIRKPSPIADTGTVHPVAGIWFELLFALSLVAAALAFYLVFPGFSIETARTTRRHFWASLGLGFAFVFAGPLLILISIFTGIGAMIGVALLALYLLVLPLGLATAVIGIGDALLSLAGRGDADWSWRVGSLLLAVLLLSLLGRVPWVGGLVVFVIIVTAAGALLRESGRRYATATTGR